MTVLQAVQFEAPLVAPVSTGLYGATSWVEENEPLRWLDDGVQIRPHNYGGGDAVGVWAADWCAGSRDLLPTDIKMGTRPAIPDSFLPVVIWGYDQCDLTPASQAETRTRAAQNLRLLEQVTVEEKLTVRLLADAPAASVPPDIIGAVSDLEAALALTGTVGCIHASAGRAAEAARYNLIRWQGSTLTTPLGHRWVFGGGYVATLGDTLVATSPLYGWRSAPTVRETIKKEHNEFIAIAERAVLVGYEHCVAAATVTAP